MSSHALPVLQIIVGSTRPGRIGLPVARWVESAALAHGGFQVELVDLADVGLPLLDEPRHPKLGEYEHQHTRDWSATIRRADAFAFVIPEYNHGINAAVKNAIDFLHQEWQHKPAGIVSYGGVSAGTRAATMLKPILAAMKMVPVFEAVPIPFVQQFLEDDGQIRPNDSMTRGVTAMLDELARWTGALRPLRTS